MSREVMKLALGALYDEYSVDKAISAIKAALAQPTQEPVAWYNTKEYYVTTDKPSQYYDKPEDWEPLYTSPPQREWIGLMDEDMDFLFPHGSSGWVQETVKIIEAKLKEKNKC